MEQQANEFGRYLKIFSRRRFLFIAVSLLVMTAVIAFCYRLPRQYKADSTVFIEHNVISNLVQGIAITPEMTDRIRVLRYAMLSRDLLAKVVKKTLTDIQPGNEAAINAAVADLQKRTDIQFREREGLFTVSLVDPDPDFATDYINTLVRQYVEENIFAKREETYGANRFLDEQLVLVKSKLDQAENAIIEYRRSQGINTAVDERTLLTDISNYQRTIEELTLAIDTQQARRSELTKQLRGVEPTVSLLSGQQQESRLVTLQQRLVQLLGTYTENYPEVVNVKAEIAALKAGPETQEVPQSGNMTAVNPLYQELRRGISDVEAEIQALMARRKMLQDLRSQREQELQNVPENQKVLAMLTQERDSHRNLYEQLLQRMGQSEVSKQMEISDKATTFRIVDPARRPTRPVSPDMIRMILLAIAGGLGAGAGLVLMLENLNSSVVQVQQLRDLGLEVCAIIPGMTDPAQAARDRRRNLLAYGASGLYFSGILGLLAFEVLKSMA
jgi:polysaccharide chain length determinant protein (PEP-CTERM system associated)